MFFPTCFVLPNCQHINIVCVWCKCVASAWMQSFNFKLSWYFNYWKLITVSFPCYQRLYGFAICLSAGLACTFLVSCKARFYIIFFYFYQFLCCFWNEFQLLVSLEFFFFFCFNPSDASICSYRYLENILHWKRFLIYKRVHMGDYQVGA